MKFDDAPHFANGVQPSQSLKLLRVDTVFLSLVGCLVSFQQKLHIKINTKIVINP